MHTEPQRPPEQTDERLLRVAAVLTEVGADWALLTSPDTVCYATGYEVPIETGPSPFQGGPQTALIGRDATCGLVVTNIEAVAARSSHVATVRDYEGFSDRHQPPLRENYLDAVSGLVREMDAGGVLAIEPATVPLALFEVLRQGPFLRFTDVDPALARTRAVKTGRELQQMRYVAGLASLGQRAALEWTRTGKTELDAFAQIRNAMENANGGRIAITGDYISGVDRTAACEGWPTDRILEDGDPVICDLSPRAAGYWGDSCNTLFLGEPSAGFKELYKVAERAIEQAADSVRPGRAAGEVAAEIAGVIEGAGFNNPLHVGHGIGTSFHEYPKIVVQEDALLEPGMVLMIEPGAYRVGVGGARLEHMFEVTETDNRILTDFEFRLA